MPGSNNLRNGIFLGFMALACYLLAFQVERHESVSLLLIFGSLFLFYFLIIRKEIQENEFWFWVFGGFGLRLIFLVSEPSLSDDVYRFIWDGRMLVNGLNPFEYLPVDVLGKYPGLDQELYDLLNSQTRPTIYPPVSQWVFWISAWLFPGSISGSIITMRAILLIAEVGLLYLMILLLRRYGLNRERALLYFINPLVIIEISGNLHFEGLMIFFLFMGLALLTLKRKILAGIAWSLAIGTKLIPLVFLPLLIRRIKLNHLLQFYSLVAGVTILLFLPLLSQAFYTGFSSAIELYFVKFEFNASIYYLLREIGYWQKGWNIIAILGPRLALTAFLVIIGYTWFEFKRPVRIYEGMMWILLLYYSLAMIVHPWYVIPIVAFAIFAKWRWPMFWSGLILLSYEGYTLTGYIENYYLIALEYIMLAAFIIYELRFRKGIVA